MHPKLDVLFARRSIRAYTDRPVPDSLLTDLLEAGMAAPSAVARDPWHFIVLRSREGLDQLAAVLPNGQMLKQAPAALVVCGDLDKAHDRELSFLLQDVSAAVENILIAASILGLGACWLGIHPRPERMAAVAAQGFSLASSAGSLRSITTSNSPMSSCLTTSGFCTSSR